jgi:hypothetical protein
VSFVIDHNPGARVLPCKSYTVWIVLVVLGKSLMEILEILGLADIAHPGSLTSQYVHVKHGSLHEKSPIEFNRAAKAPRAKPSS